MGDVTDNFSRWEFALPDGKARKRGCQPADYPEEYVDERLRPLCLALEGVRAALGGARVTVVSGYRPLEYNRAIGSEDDSQHVQGRAADVQVEGRTPEEVHEAALRLHRELGIGGLGIYDDFVHVDVRRGSHLVRWDKRRAGGGE